MCGLIEFMEGLNIISLKARIGVVSESASEQDILSHILQLVADIIANIILNLFYSMFLQLFVVKTVTHVFPIKKIIPKLL